MRYFPTFFDLNGKPCLVVGGGAVGTRKAQTLLKCGATVRVVSREISQRLQTLAETLPLTLEKRDYEEGDLDGIFLVFGATDNEALNRRIAEDAERRGLLVNIADRPEACNLLGIYVALEERPLAQVLAELEGSQFAAFKGRLTELAVAKLGPIGEEMSRLMASGDHVDQVLRDGAERARALAEPTLKEVHDIVGFLRP